MAKHWKDTDRVVHADGVDGAGYTLCGFATDGETGSELASETDEGIDCDRCIAVIRFCKKMRDGEIKAPFQRRATR